MREGWLSGARLGGVTATPSRPGTFGRKSVQTPVSFAADLRSDLFERAWWLGLARLGGTVAALALLAPGVAALPAKGSGPQSSSEIAQWSASGVASSSSDQPFFRMSPTDKVVPIDAAPERARVDLDFRIGPGGIGPSLVRSGASRSDAARIDRLVSANVVAVAAGTPVKLVLGKRHGARRPVEHLEFRAGLDLRLVIERKDDHLAVRRIAIPVEDRPLRLRGRAGDGLYFALRAAGATPSTAAHYLKAVSEEIDVGEIGSDARFDLVFANRKSADGEGKSGELLYAGLERAGEDPLRLVRWSAGGKRVWVNAATIGEQTRQDAMAWPVDAPITSRFGRRVHPILRFARMHRGVDFGARWGTPIRAAADGRVTRAGWAGGYGRQVRLAHDGGLATSYSHMSSLAVAPGAFVSRGQVIGYVGSSGLSTGPHLHYEVHRGGQAIDPLSVRFVTSRPIDPATVAAVKARLKMLTGIGVETSS